MYLYDSIDQTLVDERVLQFKDQTARFLSGELSEDEFRPLRLQNGLYIQRHAPMLRVAIPYGELASHQLRKLAYIARTYDRNYGHFTTRQNIQFNWPELKRVPDLLADLATVQMHAIQTSGNCIRNVTSDPFAGVAPDEIIDPRAVCELLRQWSTFHPEFAFLPRKFKIAVNGAEHDRAAVQVHDIGIHATRAADGGFDFTILEGGGLGRTPLIGHVVRERLPRAELINYLEAILRVYNLHGRRDNKYKARIKILLKELGPVEFCQRVEAEWRRLEGGASTIPETAWEALCEHWSRPSYETFSADDSAYTAALTNDIAFGKWASRNTRPHKQVGYRAVVISLKKSGLPPGDITDKQMDLVADLAERYSFGELRVTHEQNLVLADVKTADLQQLWFALRDAGLATPNIGLLTDIIACPGGDFCSLANAVSIPVANAIQERFDDLDYLFDLGDIELNISGCMNSCGHHHVGHIGILGVDKNGEEWYQISIGGSQGNQSSLAKVIGPSFARAQIPDVIAKLIDVYVELRHPDERFIDTARRVGILPFKERVYGKKVMNDA